MKYHILLLAAVILITIRFSLNVLAEERVLHYEATKIETSQKAQETLEAKSLEIAEILKAKPLSNSDLERIHEISYTLESAIDFIIAEKSTSEDKASMVDEAIQAIHNNSENHQERAVREWFPKLEATVANLKVVQEIPVTDTKGRLVYDIVIKDHKFSPDEIHVPAGQKMKLLVHNQDSTPEEFESDDMRREKIIAGNSSATILVGPLKPGKYHFFGEFNLDTANGYLIAE